MIVAVRKAAPGAHSHARCEAPGCGRSGRYVARFLGGYDTRLCSHCRNEWAKAWDDAKRNWQEAA